ncbi:MAG: thymidine phosphorylase [Eubacteriales bacterium]|nr:thymidine phosphorylase [Eubacteriales bacterium]
MRPTEVIMKKRLGQELTREEIACFVKGATDGSFADYQLSAMLMAICLQGMTDRETVDLTMEMARSGDMLDLSAIPGVKADKHSTGGVGDTTTLIVAPLTAACGLKVAKMSGRGLGYTGGTLDKLESIPGVRVDLTEEQFIRQVTDIGLAVIGQTADLAPADKTLYALRDVTATVDCMPLIVSSILSKKIAAGCDAVVLDVKTGEGALMQTEEDSVRLAEEMVKIGSMTGRRFSALVTGMEQPLGNQVGNALEVEEAVWALSGRAEGDLLDVSLALGAQMLCSAGLAQTHDEAIARLRRALDSGEGLRRLGDLIEAQGGDRRVTQDTSLLPHAKRVVEICAQEEGYVQAIATREIGYAAQMLGAGRLKKTDAIDPAAGVVIEKRLGDFVRRGDCLMRVHLGTNNSSEAACERLKNVYTVGCVPPEKRVLIHRVVTKNVK